MIPIPILTWRSRGGRGLRQTTPRWRSLVGAGAAILTAAGILLLVAHLAR